MNKWIQARVSQFWTIDIWGQKILCGGGLCVVQHPWHAPTRFQGHLFPHLGWPKTSQDIVRCSRGGQNAPWLRNSAVGRNNPWLWWHHRETTRLHASPGRSTRHHLGNSYQSRTKTNWSELSLYSIGLTKKFILVFSRRCYGNPIISIDISLSLSHTHTHTHTNQHYMNANSKIWTVSNAKGTWHTLFGKKL